MTGVSAHHPSSSLRALSWPMSPKSATRCCLYHFIVFRTFSLPDISLFIYLFAALPTVSPSTEQLNISVLNK